jgi:hypothetical protein
MKFSKKMIMASLFMLFFTTQSNAQNVDGIPINCDLSWDDGLGSVFVTLGRVRGNLNDDDILDWGKPFSDELVDRGDMLRSVTPETIVGQALVRVSAEANGIAIYHSSPVIFVRNGVNIEVDQRGFWATSPITSLAEFIEFMQANPNHTCEIR